MPLGQGEYSYDYYAYWAGFESAYHEGWIPGVACDSQDRVFIYSRSEKPLNVYDRDGNHLATWGEGILNPNCAHGIFIDRDDQIVIAGPRDTVVADPHFRHRYGNVLPEGPPT